MKKFSQDLECKVKICQRTNCANPRNEKRTRAVVDSSMWGNGNNCAIGNSCNFYRLLRNSGSRKPRMMRAVKKFHSTLIYSREFRWLSLTVDLPLMIWSETVQVDTSPVSELNVSRERAISPETSKDSWNCWAVCVLPQGHWQSVKIGVLNLINLRKRTDSCETVWIGDYTDLYGRW